MSSFFYEKFHQPPEVHRITDYERPRFDPEVVNRIWCQSSERMSQVPDGIVGLVVTSPPYHVGMDYDDEGITFTEWIDVLSAVLGECHRVLEPGGVIAVNVANLGRKPYLRYNDLVARLLDGHGFLHRGEIIWEKSRHANGTAWGTYASAKAPVIRDCHEYVLIAQKGQFSRARSGVSDVDRIEFQTLTSSIWRIPSTNSRVTGHPAAFPVELPRRLIHLFTYTDDVVLDPFMGSGSTAIAAEQLNRDWIGYELDLGYAANAQSRIYDYRMSQSQPSILGADA